MKTVIIDGKRIHSKEDLHDTLQLGLELGQTYGRNLDALWDSLSGFVQMPLTILWLNFEASRESLGEYADQVLNLMLEAEEELKEFTFEMRR